jgi:hypothetical protein
MDKVDTINNICYPENYTEKDKCIYDDLISRGCALIGKKISKKNEFLLDLAAKITINQMHGYSNEYTPEQLEEMKKMHKDSLNELNVTTPLDIITDHPLNKSAEEYYKERRTNPNEALENYQQDNEISKFSCDENDDNITVEMENLAVN